MTAVQMDLLADLEAEQAAADQDAARRAGDFTWVVRFLTTGKGGRASCIFCRSEARWDHVKNWCSGTRQGHRAGSCMRQFFLTNQLRADAGRVRDAPTPAARADLAYRIAVAQAAQVDVDAILAEVEAQP